MPDLARLERDEVAQGARGGVVKAKAHPAKATGASPRPAGADGPTPTVTRADLPTAAPDRQPECRSGRRRRQAGSVAAGDPLLQVRRLGADRGVVAVAGVHHRLGRQRQQLVPDRLTMVGKSLNDRPVAPGPPLNSVSPVKTTPSAGRVEAAGTGGVAGGVQHVQVDVADRG